MEEIWKPIKGYEGIYEVSNLGKIKSLPRKMVRGRAVFISKEKILKQSLNTMGYKIVNLAKDKKHRIERVHRLVACAFLGDSTEDKPIINHKDGNKTNNVITNLEWCNNSHNQLHAIEKGMRKSFTITEEKLKEEYFENNLSAVEIAKKYNTTKAVIHNNFKKYKIKGKKKSKYILSYEFLEEKLRTKSQKELAEELGCTQSLISHTLKNKRSGLV